MGRERGGREGGGGRERGGREGVGGREGGGGGREGGIKFMTFQSWMY